MASPLAGGGCQSAKLAAAYTQADDFKAFVGVGRTRALDTLYHVAAPDTLHITVLRGGEAVDHRVILPPDGRVLLPGLAWPVNTTGLTPGEVAQDLEQAILAADPQPSETSDIAEDVANDVAEDAAEDTVTESLATGPMSNRGLTLDAASIDAMARHRLAGRDPVYVAVRVERFASRQIFVLGQVKDSGSQAWNGQNRLSTVLAAAVPGHRADLHRVLVLRPGPDGDPRRRVVVSAHRLLHTGDNTLDVALEPGDIVFVPATGLGRLGLAIDRVRPRAHTPWTGIRPEPFFPALVPSRVVVADPATPTELSAADEPGVADASLVASQTTATHVADTATAQVPPAEVDSSDAPQAVTSEAVQFSSVLPVAPTDVAAVAEEPQEPSHQTLMEIRSDTSPLALADAAAAQTDIGPQPAPNAAPGASQAQVHFWAP